MRIALCGLVAGVVWNLLSAVFLAVFAPDFVPSVRRSAPFPAQGGAFFFAVDLLMGVWAVWLYSALVPRYGANPITMATAGVAWWSLRMLQSLKWAGLGFVALGADVVLLGAATVVSTLVATTAGAWLYERSAPAPTDRRAP
jgi:hypothetical protein